MCTYIIISIYIYIVLRIIPDIVYLLCELYNNKFYGTEHGKEINMYSLYISCDIYIVHEITYI